MRHQPLSPAHQAVADHDLNRLRDLLDNGHDIENDNGDGWSLLRRAIHAEADRHTRTGEPPHADMTAFLLTAAPGHARAAPQQQPRLNYSDTGWPPRSSLPGPSGAELTETRAITGRIQ